MRVLLPLIPLAALLLPATAPAQQARPQRLGEHEDWTAATYQEGGQKVCYAFTRPKSSEGVPDREDVMLTVTHRPSQRDAVILSAGYAYPRGAEVQVEVGGMDLDFYTAGSSAAARNGDAAIRAFKAGLEAVATGPGPGGRGRARDSFSLSGFTAAYEAISRACPAGR